MDLYRIHYIGLDPDPAFSQQKVRSYTGFESGSAVDVQNGTFSK